MASLRSITSYRFAPLSKPNPTSKNLPFNCFQAPKVSRNCQIFSVNKRRTLAVRSAPEQLDVIPVQSVDSTDQQEGAMANQMEREAVAAPQVVGFATAERQFLFGFSSAGDAESRQREEMAKFIDRTVNIAIVAAAGAFAITKLLIIGSNYWHVSVLGFYLLSCLEIALYGFISSFGCKMRI